MEPVFIHKYRQEECVEINFGENEGKWFKRADGILTELPNINEENRNKIKKEKRLPSSNLIIF